MPAQEPSGATDWIKWIERARNHWPSTESLVIALALAVPSAGAVNAIAGNSAAFATLLLQSGATTLLWLWHRRVPRARPGRVALLVAVDCESPEHVARFRSDFVRPLRAMLSQGDTFSAIDLLELPYARRLEIDTAEHARALQRKSKAAFVLYGRLRCRDAGTRIWRLDIRGLVSHGEIGHNNQKRLEREFSELLPRKKELPDHSALPEFELLSAVVDVVSRYVIAIAINVSGDPRRASSLFQTVADACSNQEFATEPVITSIRDRLPIRFYEVFTWAAQLELRNWLNTRDEKRIAEATIQLERVPASERHRPDYLGTLALCKFVASRDVRGAEALLKSPNATNPAFEMSLAFLGNL